MHTSTSAALVRAGTIAILAMLSLLLAPFATASPGAVHDPSIAGGDEVIGTLPHRTNAEVTRSIVLSTSPLVIERRLAGEDGVTISAQHGGVILVARSGTMDATAATPETWSASWVSGGTTFTVTITQAQNETDDQAADRLDRKVRAMQRLRPRDGDSTGPIPKQVWSPEHVRGWQYAAAANPAGRLAA